MTEDRPLTARRDQSGHRLGVAVDLPNTEVQVSTVIWMPEWLGPLDPGYGQVPGPAGR